MVRRRRQRGAAIVEFALVVVVFFVLIFGGFELTRMILEWGRTVDATRAGMRVAMVTTPPSGCQDDEGELDCSGNPVVCSPDADSRMLQAMQRRQPLIAAENVQITYTRSDTGAARRPAPVCTVRVETTGLVYEPVVPGLLGIPGTIPIPAFPSTQTGESMRDLDSP